MVLSNKIQFAFLAIFDLVHNKELGSITLADIAERQHVSIRAQYWCSKKERRISSAAKTSLASLDGFIYRHLKSISVREAIKLI